MTTAHTVRDLQFAVPDLRADATRQLVIDGETVASGSPLTGLLRHGSTIAVSEAEPQPEGSPVVELVWHTGPDAGRVVSLGVGRHLVGCSPRSAVTADDPTIAHHHAMITVAPNGSVGYQDLGIGRPARLDGELISGSVDVPIGSRLEVGAGSVTVRLAQPHRAATGRGGRSASTGDQRNSRNVWHDVCHRRLGAAELPSPPVSVPMSGHGSATSRPSAIGLVATGASVVGGGVLAVLMDQPLMILMVGIGAVGAALTWGSQALASWRHGRRASADDQRAWAAFADAVGDAHRLARLNASAIMQLPDVVDLLSGPLDGVWSAPTLTACLGIGDVAWRPELCAGDGEVIDQRRQRIDPRAAAILDGVHLLHDVPVAVEVGAGQIIGIVGAPRRTHPLLRSILLQMAVGQGPAQWRLSIVAGESVDDWIGWASWFPHTDDRHPSGPLVSATFDGALRQRLTAPDGQTTDGAGDADRLDVIVLIDSADMHRRTSELRRKLATDGQRCALFICTETAEKLPSGCTDVIEIGLNEGCWSRPAAPSADARRFRPAGASVATVTAGAGRLARLLDPELVDGDGDLPEMLDALDQLGPGAASVPGLLARWEEGGGDPKPRTVIGVARDGSVEIDLERDGPHMLVAGTTGAGKSELLRTMIAGLAASSSPEHLQFLLVDYKGGSAFDACAGLPHVTGVVTDLDGRLSARVLRSLDAELVRRERLLRAAGAEHLAGFRASGGTLARLVIVLDEFASLAHELPDFVPSIVDIARRGRSLGVHLVLATQRPAGVINDDIRANTNLRVSLRLQDESDSIDVIGSPAAACLPRHRPGRAMIRFGAEELIEVQIARCTGSAERAARSGLSISEPSWARPSICGLSTDRSGDGDGSNRPPPMTSLEVLVERARFAARRAGIGAVERPWLPPLPVRIGADEVAEGSFGLVDDPDHQSSHDLRWSPSSGHLAILGTLGSGTSTALAAVASRLAFVRSPADLHLYVIEQGSSLRPLADLPHCGGRVGFTDEEHLSRMIDLLADEVDRRSTGTIEPAVQGAGPGVHERATVLVLIDGAACLRRHLLDHQHTADAERFERIVSLGPQVGIVVAVAADSAAALPASVVSRTGERWALSVADPFDAALIGIDARRALIGAPPGRGIEATTGLEFQLLDPGDLAEVARRSTTRWPGSWTPLDGGPTALPTTPLRVLATDVGRLVDLQARSGESVPTGNGEDLVLAVGLDARRLRPCWLTLRDGEHALIAGPSRSGRTSLLALVAAEFAETCPNGWLAIVPGRRADPFGLIKAGSIGTLDEVLNGMPTDRPALLLVDDAEQIDDPDGRLSAVLARPGNVRVIAAGRSEGLRANYSHWTGAIRRQRRGLLVGSAHDLDADLFGAILPRRPGGPCPLGRGWLIQDGSVEAIHVGLLDELAA